MLLKARVIAYTGYHVDSIRRSLNPFKMWLALHQVFLNRAMDNDWNVDNPMAGGTYTENNRQWKILLVVGISFLSLVVLCNGEECGFSQVRHLHIPYPVPPINRKSVPNMALFESYGTDI